MTVFTSLAVLGLKGNTSLQVILADHFDEGPFMEDWRRLSYPRPPRFLSRMEPSCFRLAFHAAYAPPDKCLLDYFGILNYESCPSLLAMAAGQGGVH